LSRYLLSNYVALWPVFGVFSLSSVSQWIFL
jgi:hypothetical protein